MDAKIDMEAAEWLVNLQDPEPGEGADAANMHVAFLEWLRRSPKHVEAFMQATEASRQMDGLDASHRIDVQALLTQRSADVIPLHETAEREALHRPHRQRLSRRWAVAAALAFVACGVAWFVRDAVVGTVYTTAIGEQRSFRLEDGSVIHLNTGSRAQVKFSKEQRHIRLLDGEAYFVVEHDASRPFVVNTDTAFVRALGTQFNVYRRAAATQVMVTEGSVQVTLDRQPASATVHAKSAQVLKAGEGARVALGQIAKQTDPDIADAVAWRERRMIFRNTPLAEVAAEFNRYNKTHIRIDDSELRTREITGIFSADHPQSLILYLRKDAALDVGQDGRGYAVRYRSSTATSPQ